MSIIHDLTQRLEDNREKIRLWMEKKRSKIPIPIYGSVDIRDAGWKVAVVDANHFPAGFNNISTEDEPHLAALLKNHINRKHEGCTWVHLYPESHTRNPGYVENVATIKRLIKLAGFRCTVGSPELEGHGSLDGISGPLRLDEVEVDGEQLLVEGERPCLVLLNNDLTEGMVAGLGAHQVSPPPHMGWQRRRKSEHYRCLQNYVDEIAEILEIDSWHLITSWFVSEDKCLEKETCRQILASEVDEFLARISAKYDSLGIEREPVAFIKNDRGTYGLGIMAVTSGEELLNLSNRKFKRLMYSKGGVDVENFLIQEGVPTSLRSNSSILEPVGYSIGGKEMFWFFRSNSKKNEFENLNTPSSKFLLPSEVNEEILEKRKLDWYELASKLSFIAMGKELDGI